MKEEPSKWVIILTLWAKKDWFYIEDGSIYRLGRHPSRTHLPVRFYGKALDELRSAGQLDEQQRDGRAIFQSRLVFEAPYSPDSPGSIRAKIGLAFFSDGDWHDQRALADATGSTQPARTIADMRDAGYDLAPNTVRRPGIRQEYRIERLSPVRPEKKRRVDRCIKRLLERSGVAAECARCKALGPLDADHRVPVAWPPPIGELTAKNIGQTYQYLCKSCNTTKRQDCRRCPNQTDKRASTCVSCYWHDPAGVVSRRISLGRDLEARLTDYCGAENLVADKVIILALEKYLAGGVEKKAPSEHP